MARKQLSVADAHFAISLTVSPLTVYLVYASFRDLFGKPTLVYTGRPKSKNLFKTFAFTLLATLIVLDLLIYLGGTHVFAGQDCGRITFAAWFGYRFELSAISFTFSGLFGIPSLVAPFFLYTIRHWKDIREERRRHMRNLKRWKSFRWVQTSYATVKFFILSQWYVHSSLACK